MPTHSRSRKYCYNHHGMSILKSQSYKHGVIHDLLQPQLLRNVRSEIQTNLSFTPKETDIYKIHQSGDLANLDGLDDTYLKLLPSLIELRDALYSKPFRDYLTHVTGAGALSGSKTDMAVNVYTPSCHLLCHDDVIGSRRVSYILYLTDPDRPWKPEWGGALRLYPTEKMQDKDGSEMKVPGAHFSKVIPPAFNQLSFFAVQPGESFHDVEEVYSRTAGEKEEEDGGRIRMAISGWYHIPQLGEEGYEEGAQERQAERSSLAQLQGKADKYDLPQPRWIKPEEHAAGRVGDDEDAELSEQDLNFLLRFMNPRYLTPETVDELAEQFSEESSLNLAAFLSSKYSESLRSSIERQDTVEGSGSAWTVSRPPHKHRFMYRQSTSPGANASEDSDSDLSSLVDELFPSMAFRKWLSLATGLDLDECSVLARRFRRGLDYTLATSYDQDDPQLEVCLGLTPTKGWGADELDGVAGAEDEEDNTGAAEASEAPEDRGDKTNGAVNGHTSDSKPNGGAEKAEAPPDEPEAVGGYEIYMAGEDDEDDAGSEHGVSIPSSHTGAGKRREKADPAIYKSGGDEEDDGILITNPASWNTLSIVLRDKCTLKFVKFVSKSAKGDRWDITGEWKVAPEEEG